ncbi:uncharacterized protein LOC144104384 isoform X6 [Amblyomma americanum]
MPPASRQYTLVGFAPELDWRPLTFLKPIPASRVCSACGLVRKRTALLPCMHVLCECCFQHCGQDGLNECPLDGNHYEKKDVALFHCTADDLLKREVNCWNEGRGCNYMTAASGISQHFLLECEHHSVRCTRCSATVLCRDVCTHLRSASCNTSTPVTSESQVPAGQVDEAASSGQITAYKKPMDADMSTHGDRLIEISHGINALKETLRQELKSLKGQSQEEIRSSNSELEQCLASCSDTVNTCLRGITSAEQKLDDKLSVTRADLSQIAASMEQVKTELKECVQKSCQQVTHCEFFVKGVKSLQNETMKDDTAYYDSEEVYLCGYCMSPGVVFLRYWPCVMLYMKYMLHKGDMDDYVQWPFKHNVRMSVLHPRGREERVLTYADVFSKKPTASNSQVFCFNEYLNLDHLIRDGYVDNDQLRIKFALLP